MHARNSAAREIDHRTLKSVVLCAGLLSALAGSPATPQGAVVEPTPGKVFKRQIQAHVPPLAPRPSIDPVDSLASANGLGFASGQGISGEVREVESGRPLANVWVVAAWEIASLTADVCFDADTARSDSAGRFELSTWRHNLRNLGNVSEQRLRLFVYRPDYELVRLEPRQILLRPLQDSPRQRLAALREIEESALHCPPYSPHDRAHDAHFQPLLVEMAAEAQALPDDKANRAFLAELRRQVAQITSTSH